ncbi:aldo/keto reductase [Streptomyces radicis]|uniref:Aldo/keto reductase n=1 Tax=Streptomyces radicis TaxID=1750517 RepID=A0A3A9WI96_9ACTN|nr:aldo/keto reductase [Streptomyces radicis]RKN12499.1 aldo/keto reductase [Streptomyces radicis]RKN27733.1 aldo/keto reductase [Streptomyces radicis]
MTGGGAGPWWFGGAGIGNLGHEVADPVARATVDAAWDAGMRGFDTAPHYGLGLSERRLGAALAGRPRGEFAVSTKVGRVLEPVSGPGDGLVGDDLANGFAVPALHRRVWDVSRAGVERSLAASLDRLGLDHVDTLYLHDPDEYDPAAAAGPDAPGDPRAALHSGLRALAALRDEGVVRAVGVGSKSVPTLTAAVETGLADVLMVAGRYTLLEQPAAALLRACAARGVRVVAAGVFNSGALSRPEPDPSLPYEYGTMPAAVFQRITALRTVCERHGVDLPTAALAFPLRAPAVTGVAVGAQSPEQIQENASRAATPVPDALWDDLVADGLLAEE